MSHAFISAVVLLGVICFQAALGQNYGPWSSCSKPCGGGLKWRYRQRCNFWQWFQCYQSQSCNTHPCGGGRVRHGGWSYWGHWSRCTKTCGGGKRTRRRSCTNPPPANGGRYCKGRNIQVRRCANRICGCNTGSYTYNKCGDRCRCYSGYLFQCTRIRKEFTSMTTAERIRYVKTIKKASTHPAYKSQYDALITIHRTYFNQGIHLKDQFLPWHRWFILQYENLLRKIDCRFTVAYWDWVSVAGNPWETNSKDLWYSGISGFGGNGNPPGSCVKTGPFRDPIWKLVPSATPPRCLKRNFNGNPPGEVELAMVLGIAPTSFDDFEIMLRAALHDNVHCLIDGTMCSRDSAAAPEFFLHHGMVDKIWEDWQKKSNAHRTAHFSGLTTAMTATGGVLPGAFLYSKALPGGIRVEYNHSKDPTLLKVYKKLRSLSNNQLRNIPRAGSTPLSQKAIKLFGLNRREVAKMRKLSNSMLKPRVRRRPSSSAPAMDRKLGFSVKKVEAM